MSFKDYIKEGDEGRESEKRKFVTVNISEMLDGIGRQMDRWDMAYYEDMSDAHDALFPEFKKAVTKVFQENAKKFDYRLNIIDRVVRNEED